MNPPPNLLVRARRGLLAVVAPRLFYALKRRYWNRAWAAHAFPSPRSFWFLPPGVIPQPVREAVESPWWPAAGRVLDIGCGDGRIAAFLSGRGFEALGVDFAAPAIERARLQFVESERLAFQVADICTATPAPGPFAAVVDRGCYHGLPAAMRTAYVNTLVACTRPGSRLLLTLKVSGRMDLDDATRTRLADSVTREARERLERHFSVDEVESIWLNSRGDDDPREALPGVVIRMTRR